MALTTTSSLTKQALAGLVGPAGDDPRADSGDAADRSQSPRWCPADVASKLLRLEPEGDDVIAAYDRLT